MKSQFKSSLIFIFIFSSISLMSCFHDNLISSENSNDNVNNTNFTAEDSFSYKIDVLDHACFSLEAVNGTIVVSQESGAGSVVIKGVKQVKSESIRDAQYHLEKLKVDVRDLSDEILVRTMQPENSGGRNYIVNYTITLPKKMNVGINSVNGNINLNDIEGNTIVNLINGIIEGDVNLPPGGIIDMNLINGNIVLDIPESTSAEIEARTINGSVGAANIDIRNKVETSNSLTGICGEGDGEILLSAINGNIMVVGIEKQ